MGGGGVIILKEVDYSKSNKKIEPYEKDKIFSSHHSPSESIIDYIYSQSHAHKEEIEQEWIRCYDLAQEDFYNNFIETDYSFYNNLVNNNKKILGEYILVASVLNKLNDNVYMGFKINRYLNSYHKYCSFPDKSEDGFINSDFSEQDIELVQSQSGCDRYTAVNALQKNGGDIVNAIMELTM